MNNKIKFGLIITVLIYSVNLFADIIIRPGQRYEQTFDELTPGTYKLTCNIENLYHVNRSIDLNVTINDMNYYANLPQRFNIYSKDFIRISTNKINLLLTNLDFQFPINLLKCQVVHTYN